MTTKAEYESLKTKCGNKKVALQAALTTLSKTKTKVTYELKSHSNIKSTYHLAGTPYRDMTDAEKNICTEAKKSYDKYKNAAISLLKEQIQTAASNESAYASLAKNAIE